MSDNDLLKEFEEDIRRERSEAMWKSFGKYVVWLSIAIVLGTASGVSWRYWQKSVGMKQTSQLIEGQKLTELGDYKKAAAALSELANTGDENFKSLALLRKAQALQAGGEAEAAKETYAKLAALPGSASAPYAAVASMAVADPSKPLPEVTRDQPFYFSRMEWRGWQLVDKGETEEAVKIFTVLLDDNETPTSIRGRVTEGLQVLAPETLVPKIAEENDTPDEQ